MPPSKGVFAYTIEILGDAHDPKYGSPVDVPLIIATDENVAEYGRLVRDFEKEEVWIEEWPVKGWRKLVPGTGTQAGLAEGVFRYEWKGDMLHANNLACPEDGPCAIGRLPKDVSPSNKTHIYIRELNYHPDGGQVFYPKEKSPFVAVLALPGDDLKPEDVVAFYFDGSAGMQIKTDIWHTGMVPLAEKADFDGKQGKVHGCVEFDSAKEFGKYLRIPMKPELARK